MTDIVEQTKQVAAQLSTERFQGWMNPLVINVMEAAAEIEHLRLSLSEARATGRREGMEAMTDALNDDALTKRAADFLLERDQQTTQDERDEGEREASAFIILQMGAAAIRAAMEK